MNADIWDFPLFMTSHFNITVLTSCNSFTQIRMMSGWWANSPHSLLIRQINLSSLELSLALRLTVFKLNGPRLALDHVAYCMLPKCVCILLKESFMSLMLHNNTLYSYHRYFVSSWNQTGIWHWNWIYMCTTTLLVPIKHSIETLPY